MRIKGTPNNKEKSNEPPDAKSTLPSQKNAKPPHSKLKGMRNMSDFVKRTERSG
jgi:hypothetical protein